MAVDKVIAIVSGLGLGATILYARMARAHAEELTGDMQHQITALADSLRKQLADLQAQYDQEQAQLNKLQAAFNSGEIPVEFAGQVREVLIDQAARINALEARVAQIQDDLTNLRGQVKPVSAYMAHIGGFELEHDLESPVHQGTRVGAWELEFDTERPVRGGSWVGMVPDPHLDLGMEAAG